MNPASARLSSLCLRDSWLHHRDPFSRSMTVSIDAQNKGGELFHPMGRVIGIVTSSSPLLFEGKTKPSLGVSIGRTPYAVETVANVCLQDIDES